MFIATLDKQIKSNDPLNQADECETDLASKQFNFLAIKRKSRASTSATLNSSDTLVNQVNRNLCEGDRV